MVRAFEHLFRYRLSDGALLGLERSAGGGLDQGERAHRTGILSEAPRGSEAGKVCYPTGAPQKEERRMEKEGILAYFGGRQVPLADARVSVLTHAFLYGTAVFEGIRGYRSPTGEGVLIFRLQEHYQRLERSCRILAISLSVDVDGLCRITTDLVAANRFREDIYIRPI